MRHATWILVTTTLVGLVGFVGTSAAADDGRVLIPAGDAVLGCVSPPGRYDCATTPKRIVNVPAFRIDRMEASQGDYRACVDAGRCSPDPLELWRDEALDRVAWGIRLTDARSYCAFRGGRLPRAEEWERAARGPRGTTYPWGDAPPSSCERATNYDCPPDGWHARVGSHPKGATPEGLFDMLGNASEWVEASAPDVSGWCAVGERETGEARGGVSYSAALALSLVEEVGSNTVSPQLGVRCVADAGVPPPPPSSLLGPGAFVVGNGFRTHEEAMARVGQLCRSGTPATVVASSSFANLKPGWFIVVHGVHPDLALATAAARTLAATKVPGAYAKEPGPVVSGRRLVRLVGHAACRGPGYEASPGAARPPVVVRWAGGEQRTRVDERGVYELWLDIEGPVTASAECPPTSWDLEHAYRGCSCSVLDDSTATVPLPREAVAVAVPWLTATSAGCVCD